MYKHERAQTGLQVRDPAVFKEHAAGKDKGVKVKRGGPIDPSLLKLPISIKSWTLSGQGSHIIFAPCPLDFQGLSLWVFLLFCEYPEFV